MSKVDHEISTLNAISVCFSKLAGKSKYHGKWKTNDQWSTLLRAYYQDVLSPSIKQNDMDGKTLDVALRKNKLIKAYLNNYVKGTNGTGIVCHSFKPRTTLNGSVTTRTTINCYITLPPYDAEPELLPGQSWWQTLPPTKTRESNRNKRIRQTLDDDDSSDEKEIKDDDSEKKCQSALLMLSRNQ